MTRNGLPCPDLPLYCTSSLRRTRGNANDRTPKPGSAATCATKPKQAKENPRPADRSASVRPFSGSVSVRDPTVEHVQHPAGAVSHLRVVRDDDHGGLRFALQLFEQIEQALGVR